MVLLLEYVFSVLFPPLFNTGFPPSVKEPRVLLHSKSKVPYQSVTFDVMKKSGIPVKHLTLEF